MINKIFKTIAICILGFHSVVTLAQTDRGPSNDERIMTSTAQLATAISVQRGLANDTRCSQKKYKPISVEKYTELIFTLEEKRVKKAISLAEREKMKEALAKLTEIEIPGKGVMWQVTYEMLVQMRTDLLSTSAEEFCDSLNSHAINLYNKAIDNLKLLN